VSDPDFPWGDPNPPGGYREDDFVGIVFSDHEHYIFDNPTGVVETVFRDGSVLVRVMAHVHPDKLFLIGRKDKDGVVRKPKYT